ncbi:MAG TPA: cupin domain-containing protein [Gemmatimonadales bacterium]|nr:cupin domain-containing protein [Gemmatimonadales bacterium]
MTPDDMQQSVKTPLEMARRLDEYWSPRVIAEVDDSYVKVAKVKGTLGWHAHAGEDELFLVLSGQLVIETRDGAVRLGPGQMHVVPKGVEHNPVAEEECCLLLFERKSTAHTGDTVTPFTRSIEEQLRAR